MSRNSVVDISTALRAPKVDFRQGQKALLRKSRPFLGPTQSHIKSVPTALTQQVKRPELEADQSVSSSVDIKNEWRNTPAPLMSSWHVRRLLLNIYNTFSECLAIVAPRAAPCWNCFEIATKNTPWQYGSLSY